MVKPIPTAWPFTAAITGLRTFHAGNSTAAALNDDPWAENVSPPLVMSAPAQNAGGVPVSTTARTSSSASARRYASSRAGPMPWPNALRTSGRWRVIVATPSTTS